MKSVDQSLAKGGARMSLRELAEKTRKVFADSRARPGSSVALAGRAYRTSAIQEWQARMAPLALISRFHPKLGYGGSAVIVLFVAGSHESASVFAQYLRGSRGEDTIKYLACPVASITQHALARMNQRIGLMTLQDITELLTPSIMLLVAISRVVQLDRCSIQQVAVPFADGAIRCDIDADKNIIIKTYVSTPSRREAPLLSELESVVRSFSAERIDTVLWFPLRLEMVSKSPRRRKPLMEMAELGVILDDMFRRHHWLAEPYSKRPDPEGEVWELARRQNTEA